MANVIYRDVDPGGGGGICALQFASCWGQISYYSPIFHMFNEILLSHNVKTQLIVLYSARIVRGQ